MKWGADNELANVVVDGYESKGFVVYEVRDGAPGPTVALVVNPYKPAEELQAIRDLIATAPDLQAEVAALRERLAQSEERVKVLSGACAYVLWNAQHIPHSDNPVVRDLVVKLHDALRAVGHFENLRAAIAKAGEAR